MKAKILSNEISVPLTIPKCLIKELEELEIEGQEKKH